MGHSIEYYDFDVKTDKKTIEREMNQRAREDGDYHRDLGSPIRWLTGICEDREQAYERIRSNDKGWYDQLAVQYKAYPPAKLGESKVIANLRERIAKEKAKRDEYRKAHSIKTFKAEFVGCPHCGSKLKKDLVNGEICPLCRTDLRSKTTLDTLARYTSNIEELEKSLKKAIAEETRKQNKKNEKAAKVMWLVKIEYHI